MFLEEKEKSLQQLNILYFRKSNFFSFSLSQVSNLNSLCGKFFKAEKERERKKGSAAGGYLLTDGKYESILIPVKLFLTFSKWKNKNKKYIPV